MRLTRPLALVTLLVAALAVLHVHCGPLFPSGQAGTGTLKVLITDKPFPLDLIESAEVQITRVDVRIAGVDEDPEEVPEPLPEEGTEPEAEEGTEENGDGGFITIVDEIQDFDLLDLRNGRVDLLANADIPAGMYDQMRIYVTRGTIRLIGDDRVWDLRAPSGESSGIKLNFTFEVVEGEETQLLLDVDLSRAFKPTPAGHIDDPATIQEFKFQPALAMRLINLLEAGTISGTVTDSAESLPLEGVTVTAFAGDDEVTTTSTDPDGTYTLMGLVTGNYRVEFSLAGYADAEQPEVPVNAGEDTPAVDAALVAEVAEVPEPVE